MNALINDLLTLQQILSRSPAGRAESQAKLARLHSKLPPPVLAHALRQHACGRAAVALVRHGVCSACHLRVASGTLQSLTHPTDLHLCENCGCFLVLDPEEAPPPAAPVSRRAVGRPAGRRLPAVAIA